LKVALIKRGFEEKDGMHEGKPFYGG